MKEAKTYKERLDEYLGPPQEGEKRVYDVKRESICQTIKDALKTNFEVTLWTYECHQDQIKEDDYLLTKEGIVHYHDKVMNGFLCFRTESDMIAFQKRIKEELKNRQ